MILSPSPEAAPGEAEARPEPARPWADVPDPEALLEIYWRYLWSDVAGDDPA